MSPLVQPRMLGPDVDGLRQGTVDPHDYARTLLDRIEAVDQQVQAFVAEPRRPSRWDAEVRALQTRWPLPGGRPPLFGVPVGIKDIVRVDGLPTRAGSDLPPEALAGPEASVIGRLHQTGAFVAGKTVTAEFAYATPGPTRNPHHPRHTPGGSSSGSAAAVAAGLVPLAIGTQTVASIIRPAAYCGVVGFKPTYGRIPIDGIIPNAPSLDTVGLFASDVTGVSLAAAILCDRWDTVPPAHGLPVLGIPTGPYLQRADPATLAAFTEQTSLLEQSGYQVSRLPLLTDLDQITNDLTIINRYELAQTHKNWFHRYASHYSHLTANAIRDGLATPTEQYQTALSRRQKFRDRLSSVAHHEGIDIWLTPATPNPAPEGLHNTGDAIMSLPWSHAGWPALTLPADTAPNHLPLGMQVIGRDGTDEQLLAHAHPIATILTPGT